jgi:hypothetical protein
LLAVACILPVTNIEGGRTTLNKFCAPKLFGSDGIPWFMIQILSFIYYNACSTMKMPFSRVLVMVFINACRVFNGDPIDLCITC